MMYFRGHSLKQGGRFHFLGICLVSALFIRDMCVQVHSQISYLTHHSMSRYSMVFCLPNCVHLSVSISRIQHNLAFVGVS
jgi:hypothetical protein